MKVQKLIIIILSLEFANVLSNSCLYVLADPVSFGDAYYLSGVSKISIIGETTSRNNDQNTTRCHGIKSHFMPLHNTWKSLFAGDEHNNHCCQLQTKECYKHMNTTETSLEYVKRVIRTCEVMSGYVSKLICRYDSTTGRVIVNKIELKNHATQTVMYGCLIGKSIYTSWGTRFTLKLGVHINTKTGIIGNTNQLSRAVPIPVGLIIVLSFLICFLLILSVMGVFTKNRPKSKLAKIGDNAFLLSKRFSHAIFEASFPKLADTLEKYEILHLETPAIMKESQTPDTRFNNVAGDL